MEFEYTNHHIIEKGWLNDLNLHGLKLFILLLKWIWFVEFN
jgi:hypothetical protein